jgi:hypothetical protein
MLLFIGPRQSVTTGFLGNPVRTDPTGSLITLSIVSQVLVEKHVEDN